MEQKEGHGSGNIREWSMKHVVSVMTFLDAQRVQHIPNLSHTQVRVMICDQVRHRNMCVATRCSVYTVSLERALHSTCVDGS